MNQLPTNEKLQIMAEVRRSVIDYLQDQVNINQDALKAYDVSPLEEDKREPDVKRIREIQAMIIREKIYDLNRHIAVIKRMYPDA